MNLEDLGRRLVEDMPDALIVANADGIIRFWNAGAERIFGFASAEAIGQSLDLITPESLRARHWAGYRRTIQTGETKYDSGDLLSVPAIRKDGRRISVQFSIMPLKSERGGLDGIAAIMRDVTADFEERKRLKQELSRTAR
jgi:PAS domain S-box-containing protein